MFEALNGELRVEAVQTLNAKTLCPVSIASHRGGIFLFFRDFRRVHLHQWLPDHNHLQDLPEPTGTIYPVLAANDRDMFHVVHNKLTGDRTFESISPGAPAPHRQTANLADAIFVHYPSAPAAAMWGDRRVAVCTSGMWDKIRIVG